MSAATNESLDTHVIGWYNEKKKFSKALKFLKIQNLLVFAMGFPMLKVRTKKERMEEWFFHLIKID
jgi:hypothetical protein